MSDHWNNALNLPSPGIPLKLRLFNGDVINGIRPSYIENRNVDDLGYRDEQDRPVLNVKEWSIR